MARWSAFDIVVIVVCKNNASWSTKLARRVAHQKVTNYCIQKARLSKGARDRNNFHKYLEAQWILSMMQEEKKEAPGTNYHSRHILVTDSMSP